MSGGSLLPVLGLLLAAVLTNRRWLITIACVVVAWLLLFPAQVQVAQQEYMRTGSRILESVVAEQRLVEYLQLSPAGTERAVTPEALHQIPLADRVWVRTLEQPLAPGTTLTRIALESGRYGANHVFISADTGWLASLAAALTGGRWLQGGVSSLAATAASSPVGEIHTEIPHCRVHDAVNPCVIIGIHLTDQWMWTSFGRLAVDASFRIEEFILAPDKALARIQALTMNGGIPAVMVFFGSSGVAENRQWMHFFQDVGVQNASMLGHYDDIYDIDENPALQSSWVKSIVGDYHPELLPGDVARLCRNGGDVVLITSQTQEWERTTQYPDDLEHCPRFNLPVEGLLPDEVADYVRQHAAQLEPLRHQRLVGLYLDGPNLFFATQLRDILSAEGYAWSGIVFGYNTREDWLAPLRGVYDDVLGAVYQRWPGSGRQIPVQTLSIVSVALLLLPLAGFVWLRGRRASLLCFALFVLLAGMVQQAFYRYPLTAWQEPLWLVLVALALAFVMAQWRHWLRARPLTKARGLKLLRAARLRTPPALVLTGCKKSGLQRAAKTFGWPLIFRSNERRFENHTEATMGAHDSVIVRSVDDWPQVVAAWDKMAASPGARPSWLVQPYMVFESSGVIRTGLVRHGQPHVRIESSQASEAVTGNQTGAVQSRLLAVQACLVSREPLLQQTARIAAQLENAPALLEFGVFNGQPVWLQCQRLPSDPLLCYGDAEVQGYAVSSMHAEMQAGRAVGAQTAADGVDANANTRTAQGIPLLLSLFNASIPFKHWCLQDGQILERSLPSQPLFAALARLLPWRVWLWASARLCDRARRHGLAEPSPSLHASLRRARVLLFLDSLVILKGRSTRVVMDDGASRLPIFDAIDSPYAAFGTLERLELTPQALTPPRLDRGLRCTADFLVRERLRCAIACALAQVSRQVQTRLQEQRLDEKVFDQIALADVRRSCAARTHALAANPALLLAAMDARAAREQGASSATPETAPRHRIESPDAIAASLQTLKNQHGVIVRARRAWMGLFALAAHVARFEIDAPVHANSHFCQRAQLLGIEVVGLPSTPDANQSRSIP